MAGQAAVTIGENQWQVSLATTYGELTTGLRDVSSLASGTGILFVLPSEQVVSVDTTGMGFPLDIIFISNNTVIDVARNIEPDYLVTEETPCDSFLEVNAGEAIGIEAGDTVPAEELPPLDNYNPYIASLVPLALLGFVCAMAGGMASMMTSSSHSSSEVRRLGRPRTEEERAKVHEEFYGTRELPPRGTGLEERGESTEGRRLGEPKVEAERKEAHEKKYGSSELPKRGGSEHHSMLLPTYPEEVRSADPWLRLDYYELIRDISKLRKEPLSDEEAKALWEGIKSRAAPKHYSMWLTPKQRETLEKKYGAVSVRWGEELAAVGDLETCERAAKTFYSRMKEVVGIA